MICRHDKLSLGYIQKRDSFQFVASWALVFAGFGDLRLIEIVDMKCPGGIAKILAGFYRLPYRIQLLGYPR